MPALRRSTRLQISSPVPAPQRPTSNATFGCDGSPPSESTGSLDEDDGSPPSESTGSLDEDDGSPPPESTGSLDEDDDLIPDLEDVDVEVNAGELCEVHMYQVRYDSRGERIVLQVGSSSELPREQDPSHEAALVLTKFYSLSKELES
jgi:hypothetical protein